MFTQQTESWTRLSIRADINVQEFESILGNIPTSAELYT